MREESRWRAMFWFILTAALIALLALGFGLKRYVCFRRKDCCGKGCGCLFPSKRGQG
jgi:hypothetical protein